MAVARSLRGRPDASPLLRSSHSGLRRPACNLVTRVTVDCKPPDHPSPIPSALGKTSDTDLFRIALKHREVTMRVRLIIGAVTLGAIACADRPGPSSGPLASRPFAGPSSQHLESVAERPFRELARVAPSHGGWYFDTLTGDLNVYLKDVREGPAAKRALASLDSQPLARARASHPHAGIVFKQGTYTFIELARWRDALDAFLMKTQRAQWWGIDHAKNQIVVGVLSGADSEAIAAMAVDLAIPAGALRFERTAPIRSEKTLEDSIRPVKGGIRLDILGERTRRSHLAGFTREGRAMGCTPFSAHNPAFFRCIPGSA